MDIRRAVQACVEHENFLGRPTEWGGGCAVDLARRFCPTEAKVIVSMGASGAATGQDWTPTPADLLGEWEVVTLADLQREVTTE